MELTVDIHETANGSLVIKETAYEQGYYNSVIAFEKSVSLTLLKKVDSSSTNVIKAYIHDHSVTDVTNKFDIVSDGYYIAYQIVLPTYDWVEAQNGKVTNILYSKGSGIFLKNGSTVTAMTDMNKLLSLPNLKSLVKGITEKPIFMLFNLWQCYLNYCKKVIEGECSKDSKCPDCNDESAKNRDLLWIFLNAIQYNVYFGELMNAQILLEDISGCNSLCGNEMYSKNYKCGCGK